MQTNLYREEILEHYHDPQNFGELLEFTQRAKKSNSFCGDEIEVLIKVIGKKVEDISFLGKGCAISIAAASILTEYAKGKSISELTEFSDTDMLSLLALDLTETRKKCALLALATLRDCIPNS